MDPLDDNELVDYDEGETLVANDAIADAAGEKGDQDDSKAGGVKGKGGYVGIGTTGFRDFLLKPPLLRSILDAGFEAPSGVQHECIPQAILGTDVICQAKSGMGKTAVFVLSTLQILEPTDGEISVLVMCHTRDLAYQIKHEYDRFSKYMENVRTAVFFGGMPLANDEKLLKDKSTCPHIVVGTPGRIMDLMGLSTGSQRKGARLDLSKIKAFVLDECDKMLEKVDMRSDVQKIFRATPRSKQVLMFSATLNKESRAICKKFMHEPMEIYVDDESKLTLEGLLQHFVKLEEKDKIGKLVDLLDTLEFNQVMIFVKSTERALALSKYLNESNFPVMVITGNMKQAKRIELLEEFKQFKKRILITTNLMGRGIDIERVNIAINYDMPENSDTYLHRVARAGRFGTKGLALSFVAKESDAEILADIQKRFEVEISELPSTLEVRDYMPE